MFTISSIQKESISANSIEFLNLYNNQQLLKMKKQVSTKSQSFHSPLTNAASPPFFGQNSIPFQNQNIQVKNQGIKNRNSASKMSPFTLHNFKKGHCALLSLYRNSKSMKQHVFSFSQMIKQIQNVLFASAQFQQFCTNSNQSCIYDTIEIEDFITQNLSHLGTTLITRLLDILKMKKKLRMMLQIIYDYVSQSIVRDLILAGCYAILEYQNISQFKLDRQEVEQLATDHGFIARMFSDPTMWLLGLSQFQSNSSFMGSKLGQQLCLFMPFYSLTILLVFDNYNDNSYYELLAEREWKHRKQSQFRKRIHKFRENKLVKQKGM